jgi:hypothetical protein
VHQRLDGGAKFGRQFRVHCRFPNNF